MFKNSIIAFLLFSISLMVSSCSFLKDSETAKLRKEIEELRKKKDTEKTGDPDTPDGAKTKKTVKMTDGYLTLRNAPDTKTGKLIAKIPNGAEVLVGECQKEGVKIGGREGHWCRATYKDQEGWVFDAWLVEEGAAKESLDNNYLITAKSAGAVRFGMTIAEARKILKGAKFKRDMDDGEGVIISVDQGGKSLMWLYVDEGIGLDDIEKAPIVENGKIEGIKIFDSRYKTAQGVHCGMTVSEAEKRFGKLKHIFLEGLTGNEVATFTNSPKGFDFWISPGKLVMTDGQYNTAGIYGEKDPDNTTRYHAGAKISQITIPGSYEQYFKENRSNR